MSFATHKVLRTLTLIKIVIRDKNAKNISDILFAILEI